MSCFFEIVATGQNIAFILKLYDDEGKLLDTRKMNGNNMVDLSFLNSGIYLLLFESDETKCFKKLMIE